MQERRIRYSINELSMLVVYQNTSLWQMLVSATVGGVFKRFQLRSLKPLNCSVIQKNHAITISIKKNKGFKACFV